MTVLQRLGWLTGRCLQFLAAVLLCQSAIGALVIVGWVSRRMQRDVLRRLWTWSPAREEGVTWTEFVRRAGHDASEQAPHLVWGESWHENGRNGLVRRWWGGLWLNLKRGVQTSFNIMLFLLPAELFWLCSWTLGWNISFFKLYEQSELGAMIGLLGLLFFVIAMLYIPLAHVRQSVTGDGRSWYAWKQNIRLMRRGMLRTVPIGTCFAIASFVVLLFRVAPYFLGSAEGLAEMDAASLRQWLSRYYLFASLVILPMYMAVWWVAARVYCGIVAGPNRRPLLTESEERVMSELGYSVCRVERQVPLSRKIATGLWQTVPLLVGVTLTPLLWLAIGVEVYVGQFFHYIPVIGWLNQPMILLPWIRYIPPGLG